LTFINVFKLSNDDDDDIAGGGNVTVGICEIELDDDDDDDDDDDSFEKSGVDSFPFIIDVIFVTGSP